MSFEKFYNQGRATQALFESVHTDATMKGDDAESEAMMESVDQLGEQLERGEAMAAVIEWAESGEPSADNFDAIAQSLADIDEDAEGDITDEEQSRYEDAIDAMSDALLFLGVEERLIESLLDGDDKAARKVFVAVSEADALEDDEAMMESIAKFSVLDSHEAMLEAVKKVVRNGKVKWVKKPLRKKRLNGAQRAGLKKARMKSNTSAAKAKRGRSMKRRKASGL
ncbi:MAG: hypothetical protein ACRC1W_17800 [Shewanella sp.]